MIEWAGWRWESGGSSMSPRTATGLEENTLVVTAAEGRAGAREKARILILQLLRLRRASGVSQFKYNVEITAIGELIDVRLRKEDALAALGPRPGGW